MSHATPGSVAAFADTPAAVATLDAVPHGFWSRAVRRIAGDPAAFTASLFLALLIVVAVLGPTVSPFDATQQLDIVALKSRPPSAVHWFGTDPLSRDVFSRVLSGARVSLAVAASAVLIASVVGTLFGATAGFRGGKLDTAMMRFVDALLSIPRILLLLVVVALWGALSPGALVLLLGLTGWFGVSRLVRAEVLAIRDREFVEASRALGCPPWRVLVRHVIPHVLAPVLIAATLGIANVVVAEAGLSYLGHGIPQPRASWGSVIADGRDVLASAWWVSFFPGLALALTVLAFNVIADRLRRALNPRQLPAP